MSDESWGDQATATHSGLSIMGLFQGPQPGALSQTGLSISAGSHSPSVSSSQSSGFSAVGSGICDWIRLKFYPWYNCLIQCVNILCKYYSFLKLISLGIITIDSSSTNQPSGIVAASSRTWRGWFSSQSSGFLASGSEMESPLSWAKKTGHPD